MDVERVEQFVQRCSLQELEHRNGLGVYVLGNSYTKPARWYVRHEPAGSCRRGTYESRGLNNVLDMIEQTYPDFYAWLLLHFS